MGGLSHDGSSVDNLDRPPFIPADDLPDVENLGIKDDNSKEISGDRSWTGYAVSSCTVTSEMPFENQQASMAPASLQNMRSDRYVRDARRLLPCRGVRPTSSALIPGAAASLNIGNIVFVIDVSDLET